MEHGETFAPAIWKVIDNRPANELQDTYTQASKFLQELEQSIHRESETPRAHKSAGKLVKYMYSLAPLQAVSIQSLLPDTGLVVTQQPWPTLEISTI